MTFSEQIEIKPFLEGQSDKWEIKEYNGGRPIPILGIETTAGMAPCCAAAKALAQYEWMKTLTSSVGNENKSSQGKNTGNKL